MALPTLSQNYELTSNQSITGDADLDPGGPSGACNSTRDRRNLLLAIKNQMIAAGNSNIGPSSGSAVTAWSVYYSCGGNNGGSLAAGTAGDGVDRWDINTDLVFETSGNDHSWIVLEQDGIATNFQICIECQQGGNGDDGAEIEIWVSPSAQFSGGSTSARPTASDELMLRTNTLNDGWSGAATNSARTWKWNMWRAEDGSVTYVLYFLNDVPLAFWIFAQPQSPVSGWSGTQFVAAVFSVSQADTNSVLTIEHWYDADNLRTYRANRISTADPYNLTSMYLTADTFGGQPFTQQLTIANDVSGEYALGTMGIASTDGGFVGRMGTMYDIYWGQDPLGSPVDTFPSGGSKTWVQFGDFVFGWDGSTPVTS